MIPVTAYNSHDTGTQVLGKTELKSSEWDLTSWLTDSEKQNATIVPNRTFREIWIYIVMSTSKAKNNLHLHHVSYVLSFFHWQNLSIRFKFTFVEWQPSTEQTTFVCCSSCSCDFESSGSSLQLLSNPTAATLCLKCIH